MMKKLAVVLFGSALMLTACGGGGDDTDTKTKTEAPKQEEAAGKTVMDQKGCLACHGQNLEGGVGVALTDVGSRLSEDEIREVIVNGRGAMPKQNVEGEELDEIVNYLLEQKGE